MLPPLRVEPPKAAEVHVPKVKPAVREALEKKLESGEIPAVTPSAEVKEEIAGVESALAYVNQQLEAAERRVDVRLAECSRAQRQLPQPLHAFRGQRGFRWASAASQWCAARRRATRVAQAACSGTGFQQRFLATTLSPYTPA